MPIKAVIDTNVWVSALLNPGMARQIVHCLHTDGFQVVCADELLAELLRVLSRPRITAMVAKEDVGELLAMIQDKSCFVQLQNIPSVSRDPNDDMLLACALAAQADNLVTGDDDLQCLQNYQGIQIITPARFCEILGMHL